jgi:hypothetical protein
VQKRLMGEPEGSLEMKVAFAMAMISKNPD